ncbi:hypothetical protein HNY73_006660 [Argiope bruennichi]|uniref:Uncharacterized protein n=1 Tax=Argiope bruennichi TaxID=94029 RepID=A0A8T0FGQ1_ARGBR|nr:hypothetical protein HNY73_006660 [Argiope bruennichi]
MPNLPLPLCFSSFLHHRYLTFICPPTLPTSLFPDLFPSSSFLSPAHLRTAQPQKILSSHPTLLSLLLQSSFSSSRFCPSCTNYLPPRHDPDSDFACTPQYNFPAIHSSKSPKWLRQGMHSLPGKARDPRSFHTSNAVFASLPPTMCASSQPNQPQQFGVTPPLPPLYVSTSVLSAFSPQCPLIPPIHASHLTSHWGYVLEQPPFLTSTRPPPGPFSYLSPISQPST